MINMKNLTKCLTAIVGLCLAAGQLSAAQTNLVQSLKVGGILYYQGATVTNGTATTVARSVIRSPFNNQSLISRFGQVAQVTFSSSAKLLVVSSLINNNVSIVVQDGTNRVNVSSYFEVGFDNDPVVEASTTTVGTGATSATRYQLMKFKVYDGGTFGSLGIHFDTDGLGTVKSTTLALNGTLHPVDRPTSKVSGKGKSDNLGGGDSDFLAALTFSISGGTVEVRP